MLNFELADHPVYDGGELQWFDDEDHGTACWRSSRAAWTGASTTTAGHRARLMFDPAVPTSP